MTIIGHHAVVELTAEATARSDQYLAAADDAGRAHRQRTRHQRAKLAAALAIASAADVPHLLRALSAVDAEVAQERDHLAAAVHTMQSEERRADAAEDVLRALIWAYGSNDERAMEQAIIAAISHLHDPHRRDSVRRDAAAAGLAALEQYPSAACRPVRVVAS
jgi:hypothetical protein